MNNLIKQTLLDIIDFVRFKVDTDSCTSAEMQAVFKILQENNVTKATTKDIADFYGQSNSNVRNIVSRWGIKGENKRYYDFNRLQKFVPKSWRKSKKEQIDAEAINSVPIAPRYTFDAESNIAADSETQYGEK